jgi:SAM-dependent methyltransferase
MSDTEASGSWRDGDSYERYVGRWSGQVAAEFVPWLEVAPRSRWLDVGCGTGALSSAVLDSSDPAAVFGVEPSAGFLKTAVQRLSDRATLVEGAAESIPLPNESFDAVVSGLVLNFVGDQPAALAEMTRVATPGATIAAYVWDYGGGMQFMKYFWQAAAGLDGAADADETARFPICNPDALLELFTSSGLVDTTVRAIDIPTRFVNFDDYWHPFLGGTGVAPGYVATLDESSILKLRERLRRTLRTDADGAIPLTARAWAVRGVRP